MNTKPAARPLNQAELRALAYLRTADRRAGVAAGLVGAAVWPGPRRGHVVSSNGGGDYAAQMLLGRLRRRGLVRTLHTEGSSRWVLS